MQRLRETLAGTDTLEGRVAFLLRAAPAPAALSGAAVQRIAAHLPLASVAKRRSRMLSWPMSLLLPASLALASSVALNRLASPKPRIALGPVVEQATAEPPVAAVGTVATSTAVTPVAPMPSVRSSAPPSRPRRKARSSSELDEAAALRKILELARSPAAAGQALEALADYRRRFPAGTLSREADLAEVRADVALGRRQDAIETLDRLLSQRDPPRAISLSLLRGELLSKEGRCADALASWRTLTAQSPAEKERLMHGRAFCLVTLGRWSESQDAYRAYLKAFPEGRFAGEARVALSGWDERADE